MAQLVGGEKRASETTLAQLAKRQPKKVSSYMGGGICPVSAGGHKITDGQSKASLLAKCFHGVRGDEIYAPMTFCWISQRRSLEMFLQKRTFNVRR